MARSDYGPEVKSAMKQPPRKGLPGKRPPPDTKAEAKKEGDTPAELARDKARGIAEGSPRDEALDMGNQGAVAPPSAVPPTHPPSPGGGANPAHAAIAASIAHAILGGGRGGGY